MASGANSEPTPGPVFDEASSGTAKGDAEYRRWRPSPETGHRALVRVPVRYRPSTEDFGTD